MNSRLFRGSALAATLTAVVLSVVPARAASAQSPATLLGYHTVVPAGWTPRAPASSMRLAEYTVPPGYGAGPAEVVVYFFGKGQGGSVDANLERWRGQFSSPSGTPVAEVVMRDSTGAFPITFAEFRGTYRRGFGAGSADSVHTGQELVAAVAETPRGTLFFQLFGPITRVAAERKSFMNFVKGLK